MVSRLQPSDIEPMNWFGSLTDMDEQIMNYAPYVYVFLPFLVYFLFCIIIKVIKKYNKNNNNKSLVTVCVYHKVSCSEYTFGIYFQHKIAK